MTREEREKAIDALKISAPVMAVTQEEFNDYIQTLNKIMNWLEQEPRDDAISRQAVLDAFWKLNVELRPNAIDAILNMVNSIPPVIPAEKVGRWIYIGNKDINQSVKIVECNVCHKRNMGSSDYCPSCGAKMQEVKNNEIDN